MFLQVKATAGCRMESQQQQVLKCAQHTLFLLSALVTMNVPLPLSVINCRPIVETEGGDALQTMVNEVTWAIT